MSSAATEEVIPGARFAKRSPAGTWTLAAAFLLMTAASPTFFAQTWAPKVAIVVVLGLAGLPVLGVLLSRRDRVAWAAATFLLIALASAILAPTPMKAFFGMYGWSNGVLYLISLGSAWALGRALTEADRRALRVVLAAGLATNAAVAVGQTVLNFAYFPFTLYESRAAGLLGNPVHLAVLAAAAAAMAAFSDHLRKAAAVALIAGLTVQLSGSRTGVIVGVAFLVVAVARRWRRWPTAVAFLAGVGLAAMLASAVGTVTASERLESANSGDTARLESWMSARHALAKKPLLGVGPAHYRAATTPLTSVRQMSSGTGDFADAHNWIVELATTTGILGIVALFAWLMLGASASSGPLRAAALAVLAGQLVQPQHIGLTPLAFLLLGAAHRERITIGPTAARARIVCAVVALVPAIAVLNGDRLLLRGYLDTDVATLRSASAAAPAWVRPADTAANAASFRFLERADWDDMELAIQLKRDAVRRDPGDHWQWLYLGQTERYAARIARRNGHDPEPYHRRARAHLQRALELQPWEPLALLAVAGENLAEGRWGEAAALAHRAQRSTPDSRRAVVILRCAKDHLACVADDNGKVEFERTDEATGP